MNRWPSILPILALAFVTGCRRPSPARHEGESPRQTETAQPAATKAARLPESDQIAALIDPEKLATLKIRGANPRILKISAILWTSKMSGKNPTKIVEGAIEKIGWGGTAKGQITSDAILRNLEILEKLGSTTSEDIDAMRRGKSPIVRKGPYTGDIVSVDHIIPVAVATELSNCIANLELMPLRLNQSKNDKIGDRQRDLAQKLHAAGLLENPGKVR